MPLLVLRDVHKFDPLWDKGQRGGGRFFIKEQWEKSLLPLGPDSNNGYLLH